MSFSDALKSKLHRIAGESARIVDGWRELPAGDADSALTAVAAEVDDTVFPRRLGFRNAAGEVLWVVAGHRRLQRLVPPVPGSLAGQAGLTELVDTPLAEAEEAQLARLGEVLGKFAADELWVRPEPAAETAAAPAGGVSAVALARLWDVAIDTVPEVTGPPELDEFLARLGSACTGWARIDAGGAVIVAGGAYEDEVPAPLLKDLAQLRDAIPSGLAILGRGGSDRLMLCARDDETALLAQTEGLGPGALCARWFSSA